MSTSTTRLLYRISAVLLAIFGVTHQLGFQRADPSWNAAAVVQGMQGTHFLVGSFDRSYWMFFSGFGYFVTALLLFSAVLSWGLSNATNELHKMAIVPWSFALCYAGIAVMTWEYFFVAPGIFATVIALLLIAAAFGANATKRVVATE